MEIPVIVLFGPTASGKTALIKRLFTDPPPALEQEYTSGFPAKAEIISADSMQVYRGMDIGTAKPPPEERAKIPHHLIDIRNPDEQFNAGEFVRLAEKACAEVYGRDALPVVSGGTGFYLKNLVQGLSEAPPSDTEVRQQLKDELSQQGPGSLMEELKKADPVSANRIHINDEYRLIRALEVYRLTGQPLSSYVSPWQASGGIAAEASGSGRMQRTQNAERPFRFLLIGIKRNREELYRRITMRTAAMFKAGLPGEVRKLFDAGYSPADPGLRAIGYREFFIEEMHNEKGRSWHLSEDLAGVEALVAQNSRRYAKRQITFFASIPESLWIDFNDDSTDQDNTANKVISLIRNHVR